MLLILFISFLIMENLEKSDGMHERNVGGGNQEELGGVQFVGGDVGGKTEAAGGLVLSAVEVYDSLNGEIQDGTSKMGEVGVVFDRDVASTVGFGGVDGDIKTVSETEDEDMHETVDNSVVALEEQEDKNDEEGEEEGEGVEIQDHEFSVGEFVWAKTLNRPWWPGQIYDPSDASKDIAMYNRKGRVLVVFFGKETSAWCCLSQVKPFQEIFDQISMLGNPSSFYNAVEEALSRIGRCSEREMTCSCAPLETRNRLARPLASNSGIKEGVIEPEGKVVGLSAMEFEPAKFLVRLHCFAEIVSEISPFERTVFQSQLMAFNHANGWCQPCIYLELMRNSDCTGSDGWAINDNANAHSPTGESSKADGLDMGKNSSVKKFHQKKRQRMNVPLALESKRRKNKAIEAEINGDTDEDGPSSITLASSSMQHEKQKPSEDSSEHSRQNDDSGDIEGNKCSFLSRERKKSKYLSPPYTMLTPEYKSLMSLKDNVPNSWASQREKSWGLIKCSGRATRKEQNGAKKKKVETDLEACDILAEFYTAAVDPMYLEESNRYDQIKGFFLNMRSYRHGSGCHTPDEGSMPQCISADIALEIPREDEHKTNHPSPGENLHEVDYPNSGNCKRRKARDWKEDARSQRSQKEDARSQRSQKEDARSQRSQNKTANYPLVSPGQETHETNCPTSEGSSEMNKRAWTEAATYQMRQDELYDVSVGSPGEYMHKSDCSTTEGGQGKRGRKKKDATPGLQIRVETAASLIKKDNSQYIPTPIGCSAMISLSAVPLSAVPPTAEAPPLQVVRQNLENMTSILEKAGDKLSPDVKASLETEIKRLLEKVETMG